MIVLTMSEADFGRIGPGGLRGAVPAGMAYRHRILGAEGREAERIAPAK